MPIDRSGRLISNGPSLGLTGQRDRGKLAGPSMKDFSFTVAFLLPVKAEKTKNFRELLKYSDDLGFKTSFSRCIGDSQILLRAGKRACTPLQVANLLIALHLLATQRKEDVIIVGAVDGVKYQHRLFATLSIEKIRNWTTHLSDKLAAGLADGQTVATEPVRPTGKRLPKVPVSEGKAPVVLVPGGDEPRV